VKITIRNTSEALLRLKIMATLLFTLLGTLAGCGSTVEPVAPLLMSIAVGPPDASLAKGSTDAFTATGIYSNGSRQQLSSVTWSSANPAVASISNGATNSGLAIAVAPGSTTITATLGNVSGTTTLTVTAAALVSIGVTPVNGNFPADVTQQFKATGIYTDNSIQDLTDSVTWTAAAPAVASISSAAPTNGLATTLKPGSTMITAALGAISGATTLTVNTATLTSIGITPLNLSIAAGLDHQFTATGLYSDASTHDLTALVVWSSSATTIATISNAAGSMGLATTATPGSTTITAALGGVSGTTSLTVTAATLVSIGVTPPKPSVAAGLKQQLTATGLYTDNSVHNITTAVLWSSSVTTVAPISNATGFNGLATAASPGTTTITATLGSLSGTATLTVTPATLVSIGVTPATPSIAAGSSLQFVATGTYTDNSTRAITTLVAWTSSAATVATLSNAAGSNGLATTLAQGTVTITAALGTVSASATLTVTPATLASISITPPNPRIANGTNQQFTATGIYTDNSTQDLTTAAAWSSSATTVAGVSNAAGSNGLATALSPGSTTITATFGGVSSSTTLTVSSTSLVSIAITPAHPSITDDTNQQFTATGTFSDNSTQDLTTAVAWTSSNTTAATVSNAPGFNGFATALTPGTTTITAALNTVSASTTLTITAAPLVSIAVTPANPGPSIPDGNSQQFTAIGTYADHSTQDLTTSVTWHSSNPTTASVSNAAGSKGLALSLASGTTSISATLGGVSGATTLTVTTATLVSITVTPLSTTIANGSNRQFAAIGMYTDNSTQNLTTVVTWASSNSSVASVSNAANSKGLVSSASVGSTSIRATTAGITSPPETLTVTTAREYAYVANNGDGTVSQYTVGANGVLTAMNPAFVTAAQAGYGADAITVDPAYRYAYVANISDGTVWQFTIGATGALTAMNPAFVTAGNSPQSVTVDPSGRYAYVANNGGTVSQYTIGANGALTAMNPAFVTITNGAPSAITIDPTGHYVYVANEAGSVSQYSIGAAGTLSALSPASVTAGALPLAITVDSTGRFVYVVNGGDSTVSQYAIGVGGTLSALTPATVTTGSASSPESISVDPLGHYAYVAENNADVVAQYTIGADGSLNAITPAAVQASVSPQSVSVDLSGQYVYVANEGDDTIWQFTIGAGGALPAPSTAPVPTGSGPYAITTAY
jgi:trimeric autotransporter adhesin